MGNRAGRRAAWLDPGSFATTLVVLYRDEFGPAALHWHPAHVAIAAAEAAGAPLPEANYARLMAGLAILTTDRFYRDESAFRRLAEVLSGGAPDAGEVADPDAAECAWAITEALLLAPPDADDPEPFSAGVRRYVGIAADDEGLIDPPDVLGVALRRGARRAAANAASHAGLAEAVRAGQREKADAINGLVRGGLARLIGQVEALELDEGDARALLGRLSGRAKQGM